MTFNTIIGASPLMSCISTNSGTWISFAACEARKRTTAIISCVNRKKSGADVDWSTHLFLGYLSWNQSQRRKSTYAMTIYEIDQLASKPTERKQHIPPMLLRDRITRSPSEVSLVLDNHYGPGVTYHKEVIILLLPAGAILWRHR